jgi:hypothetical protein
MADVMEQLARAAEALKKATESMGIGRSPFTHPDGAPTPNIPLAWQHGSGAAAAPPNIPLQMARPGGNPFGNMGAEAHFHKLGLPAPGDVADERRRMFPEDGAGGKRGLEQFSKALNDPIKALDKLAEVGGKFGAAAEFAAGALRTVGALRGAYSGVMGVMERGNPNMAGQMQGTIDLMANRLAGVLSPAIEKLNAGLQGLTDAKPGSSVGGGVGAVTLPMVVMAAVAVMGGPVSMAAMAALAVVGLLGGSMIGAWLSGENALPSMRGLPQPSAGDKASDWYDQAMMKSLSLQPGTLEAELARRQIELLAAQIGLLTSIDNTIRGSGPEFR